jgi:hypothetical protein
MVPLSSRPRAAWLLGLALLALAGCSKEEEGVRHYLAPRVSSDAALAGLNKVRLLAAVVPHDKETFFFKLVGPTEAVSARKEQFETFLRSVRFTGKEDKPVEWQLAEGWKEEPGNQVRFATIRLGAKDEPLEITVNRFPGTGGDFLANVNRWRRLDLGRGPIDEQDLPKAVTDLKIDGKDVKLVDMTGPGGKGMQRPPMAGHPPIPSGKTAGTSPAARRPANFKYDKPAGWQEDNVRRSAFAPDLAFNVKDGNQEARVTVFRQAGDLLANVNRWRTGELKLPALSQAEVERLRQRIEVDGQPADFVDLVNADAPGHPRVLGVVLPRRDAIWTLTMRGPAELLEKQKPAFEAFVKSVRFAGGTGAADE